MTTRTLGVLLIVLLLLLSSCGRAIEPTQIDEDRLATQVAETLSAISQPTSLPLTTLPTATEIQETKILWACYTCGGNRMWVLGDGEPYERTLPVYMGEYHSWNGEVDRILFSKTFTSHGAGPGNVSVRDLSILDLTSGMVEVIHSDNVVEARWAPDGRAVAYILATESTYELHWRTLDGVDRVLTEDVTFTWSVAPSGEAIAFTRETGYELDIVPGLYVVRVDSGEVNRISDVDKHGTGSVIDRPVWSPDSTELILAHWGGPDEPRIVWAKADGSASADLTIDPAHSEEWWSTISIPTLLWDLDGDHLVSVPAASKVEMGGPSPLVYYFIDQEAHMLTDGVLLAEIGQLIGWAIPGKSVWVQIYGGEFQEVSLP